METLNLKIKGMHCPSCEKLVTMELEELPGVSLEKIDQHTGEATIKTADPVADESLKQAIAQAGYELVKIQKI